MPHLSYIQRYTYTYIQRYTYTYIHAYSLCVKEKKFNSSCMSKDSV